MQKALVAAALAGLVAASINVPANAASVKETCYAIAKAGTKDCGSADGAHSCAGHATKDNGPNEGKFVGKGECAKLGGTTKAAK